MRGGGGTETGLFCYERCFKDESGAAKNADHHASGELSGKTSGPGALFEAWVAQERSNAPIIGHAVITKSYDVRRACPTIVLCELYVVPGERRSGLANPVRACRPRLRWWSA